MEGLYGLQCWPPGGARATAASGPERLVLQHRKQVEHSCSPHAQSFQAQCKLTRSKPPHAGKNSARTWHTPSLHPNESSETRLQGRSSVPSIRQKLAATRQNQEELEAPHLSEFPSLQPPLPRLPRSHNHLLAPVLMRQQTVRGLCDFLQHSVGCGCHA